MTYSWITKNGSISKNSLCTKTIEELAKPGTYKEIDATTIKATISEEKVNADIEYTKRVHGVNTKKSSYPPTEVETTFYN